MPSRLPICISSSFLGATITSPRAATVDRIHREGGKGRWRNEAIFCAGRERAAASRLGYGMLVCVWGGSVGMVGYGIVRPGNRVIGRGPLFGVISWPVIPDGIKINRRRREEGDKSWLLGGRGKAFCWFGSFGSAAFVRRGPLWPRASLRRRMAKLD